MPDANSPNSIIGDEYFPVMAPESPEYPKRRFTCPGDHTIAAYVDGALRQNKSKRVESHLAKCDRCRAIVADVVKLQREVELPLPPFEIARRPMFFARGASRSYWIWAPAAIMALLVVIAFIFQFARQPQKLTVSTPSPSAPLIAKAEPPATPGSSAVRDITRNVQSSKRVPLILSPLQDSTVARTQLQITWKSLTRSRYYEVTLVTSDGDLLWEGQTEAMSLRLPSDVVLKRGSYFVWITAYVADGQVTKSSPVRFRVER